MDKKALTKIYDCHTHFNDEVYQKEKISVATIISEAEKVGVGYFNNVAFSLLSSVTAIEQVRDHVNAFAIVGIHPNEVGNHQLADLDILDQIAIDEKVVGIGEVGLDYYYTKDKKALQKEWLKKQIVIAIKHNLPLMLHIRDDVGVYEAYDDVIEIINPIKDQLLAIIVHCFSANDEYAKKFLELGAYIEIGGAVTFKNAKVLQEAVKIIPLERMLLETDAPYLTPHPFRGKINFSKYITFTVEKIAELKEVDQREIIEKTTTNALKVFQRTIK